VYQNFGCMSFLSPESVIEDRNEFALRDYLSTVSSLVGVDRAPAKTFPDCTAEIDAVRQSHRLIFPQDIAAEFDNFRASTGEADGGVRGKNAFRTSVRRRFGNVRDA
jgi:hypothetical protein